MLHRNDIDGLRALAVLAVVFFHAGIKQMGGGYVGVDVFFVISGFLITSSILKEVSTDSFSYKKFWLRRIRRIFPASIFAVFAASILFFFVSSPAQLQSFGKSVLSLSLFSSNIHFWTNTGYFTENSDLIPLLHTWSLSLEEQFYLFLPMFLVLLTKYFKSYRTLIFSLSLLVSFILSVILTPKMPAASFYLLPTRGWELGAGSLLAFINLHKSRYEFKSLLNNLFGIAGLLLICFSVFTFDDETSFPSYNALYPVLGTMLIIFSNTSKRNLVGQFLGLPLIRWVGKISYSYYLWHWILLVFYKFYQLDKPSLESNIFVAVISVVPAYLSYRYVEEPVRRNLDYWNSKKITYLFIFSTLFYAGFGGLLASGKGYSWRFSKSYIDYEKSGVIYNEKNHCENKDTNICKVINKEDSSSKIMLWGDSHAKAILPGLISAAKEKGHNVDFSILEGCPPLLDVKTYPETEKFQNKCLMHNKNTVDYINENTFKKIIILARFNVYLNKRDLYEEGVHPDRFLYFLKAPEKDKRMKVSIETLKKSLRTTLNSLDDKNVVIPLQVPNFKIHPVVRANKLQLFNKSVIHTRNRAEAFKRSQPFLDILVEQEVSTYNFFDDFCNDESCSPYGKNESYYFDDDHLSVVGGLSLKESLIKIIDLP